ncbi:MAG: hypothetical protein HQ582_31105 [Planctomycetes bacterium]|nr:hypothetical protein [Planctomycetota bacterium]
MITERLGGEFFQLAKHNLLPDPDICVLEGQQVEGGDELPLDLSDAACSLATNSSSCFICPRISSRWSK